MRAAVLLALVLGCAGSSPKPEPRGGTEPSVPQVVYWTMGEGQRGGHGSDLGSELLRVPARGSIDQGQPIARGCVRASTMLVAPTPDPTVYVVVDRALHAIDRTNGKRKELKLSGPLRLERLLATRRSDPRVLLVTFRDRQAKESLHALAVRADGTVAEVALGRADVFAALEVFFREYQTSRCRAAGEQCLVITELNGKTFIDQEQSRGGERASFLEVTDLSVFDAAWDGDEGAVILLRQCAASGD